ncbi:hypothetical protein SDC9_74691 [bioreactor metagenome]|uniref:Uncharacterized protein n=1 Tax=bioreactor metagenome TaxID=1076179 RepID=A0A644YHS5_9ZZZZ
MPEVAGIQPRNMLLAGNSPQMRIDAILLPIYPPDATTILFQWFVCKLEIIVHVFLTCCIEKQRVAMMSTGIHRLHKGRVTGFMTSNPIVGMYVHGHLKS